VKPSKPNCACGCPASYHCLDQFETNCTECECKLYVEQEEAENGTSQEADLPGSRKSVGTVR
jgi:hypothetical protein